MIEILTKIVLGLLQLVCDILKLAVLLIYYAASAVWGMITFMPFILPICLLLVGAAAIGKAVRYASTGQTAYQYHTCTSWYAFIGLILVVAGFLIGRSIEDFTDGATGPVILLMTAFFFFVCLPPQAQRRTR